MVYRWRVETQSNSLQNVLVDLQVWHLVWGVVAGLVGSILGEYVSRIHALIHVLRARWKKNRLAEAMERHDNSRNRVILQMLGLILGMLTSIRLGDRLETVTSAVVSLGARHWLVFLVSFLVLTALGVVIGGFGGHFVVPSSWSDGFRGRLFLFQGEADFLRACLSGRPPS